MTPLELQVWSAAYANEFAKDRAFYDTHGGGRLTIDDISGYSCAETADIAVDKLRDAFSQKGDREYLLPVKEGHV